MPDNVPVGDDLQNLSMLSCTDTCTPSLSMWVTKCKSSWNRCSQSPPGSQEPDNPDTSVAVKENMPGSKPTVELPM